MEGGGLYRRTDIMTGGGGMVHHSDSLRADELLESDFDVESGLTPTSLELV